MIWGGTSPVPSAGGDAAASSACSSLTHKEVAAASVQLTELFPCPAWSTMNWRWHNVVSLFLDSSDDVVIAIRSRSAVSDYWDDSAAFVLQCQRLNILAMLRVLSSSSLSCIHGCLASVDVQRECRNSFIHFICFAEVWVPVLWHIIYYSMLTIS